MVIERAQEKLKQLETEAIVKESNDGNKFAKSKPLTASIPCASGAAEQPQQNELFATINHPVVDYLEKLNPDEITAKEALKILYELKQKSSS